MVEIKPCTHQDFEAVFVLLGQLWPGGELDRAALEEVFLHNLDRDSQHCLCALMGSELVGFCSLSVKESLWGQGPLAVLDEMVVEETHRGKGIGGRLLEEALGLAKAEGCRRVELDSAFQREDAHRFYEHHGFKARSLLFGRDI